MGSLAQLDPETLKSLGITLPRPTGLETQQPAISATIPMTTPSSAPGLGITVPQSKTPLTRDQTELQRIRSTGPGEDQIYGKVTGSQFGQNHPILGKILGGLGEGLAKAGDIGLSLVSPAAAILTPGTAYHHAAVLKGAQNAVNQEEANQEKEAQTADFNAGVPLKAAQTREAEVRADTLPEQLQAALAEHGYRLGEGGRLEGIPVRELSPLQQAQVHAAENPWLKEAGNQPLGERVPQLNQAMTQRYQVLHPGEKLPDALTLPNDATKNDFDRVDKLLQSEESALSTREARADSEKMRQAMLALAERRENSSEETKGSKWVTWTDPTSGRTIAGPRSEADRSGASDVADLQGQEIRDVQNARHVVNLLDKRGDPNKPETQGVLQLIDSLDRDGKLGVLASRYNRFVTTGVGASPNDDPRVITLIDKGMLADTAAMQAHFGASGGRSPAMLQHFLDLANTGKMDGVTLRAGYKAIDDYMRDRGMMPEQQAGVGTTNAPPAGSKVRDYTSLGAH